MDTTKTTWEELCELGRMARRDLDVARWQIGDLALTAETMGFTQADFAREIGLGKRAVQQYAQMCGFYSTHARALLFATFESDVITYTHYREAARMGTYGLAFDMLEKAAYQGWTTDELAYHVGIELGNPASERVYLAKEVEGRICKSAVGRLIKIELTLEAGEMPKYGDKVKVSVWRES